MSHYSIYNIIPDTSKCFDVYQQSNLPAALKEYKDQGHPAESDAENIMTAAGLSDYQKTVLSLADGFRNHYANANPCPIEKVRYNTELLARFIRNNKNNVYLVNDLSSFEKDCLGTYKIASAIQEGKKLKLELAYQGGYFQHGFDLIVKKESEGQYRAQIANRGAGGLAFTARRSRVEFDLSTITEDSFTLVLDKEYTFRFAKN